MLWNLHDPKKTGVILNPRIKHLLATINHQDGWRHGYFFGNSKIAGDVRKYAKETFKRSSEAIGIPGIRPTEALKKAAEKNSRVMEKLKQEKQDQDSRRLRECDNEADQRGVNWKKKLDSESEVNITCVTCVFRLKCTHTLTLNHILTEMHQFTPINLHTSTP